MRIKHAEFSIYVRAPYHRGQCLYGTDHPWRCKNDGSLAISVHDDRDQMILQYANICSAHLLQVVISELTEH